MQVHDMTDRGIQAPMCDTRLTTIIAMHDVELDVLEHHGVEQGEEGAHSAVENGLSCLEKRLVCRDR